MASDILVGIDGSERGLRALEWAAQQAGRESGQLTLLAVVDPDEASAAGADMATAHELARRVLDEARSVVSEKYPDVPLDAIVAQGKIIDRIVEAADEHDLVVLGTHHGAGSDVALGAARGLRVSVSTRTPTVVVPCDWEPAAGGSGIVAAVGPDDSCDAALEFAVREALRRELPLTLVSAWAVSAMLARSARAKAEGEGSVGERRQAELDERVREIEKAHPSLVVSGRAVEGTSPAHVLLSCSRGSDLLVLGTHSRGTLGRAMFGSVTHAVLLNPNVPTVVVPQR
ncbi:MAG: universal stress protein [Coriobacteriia bacterium]|nr:universal stress protein [Coriobacteriia bacterium]MBS5479236.1 universal stress protein [Coriobacteriia bacterium]